MQLANKARHHGAVGTVPITDNLVWCRRSQDKRVCSCLNRRKAVRVAAKASLIGIAARSVNDGEPDACTGALELRKKTVDAHPIPTDIPFPPNLRVDRDQLVLTIRLHAGAAQMEQ